MGWEWRCFWRVPDSYSGCLGGEQRTDVYFNSRSSNVGIKLRGERQDGYYEVKRAVSKLDMAENLQKQSIKLKTQEDLLKFISNLESSSSSGSSPPAATPPVEMFRMQKSRDKRFSWSYIVEWCHIEIEVSLDSGDSWSSCGRWVSLCVENVKPPKLQTCIDAEMEKKKTVVKDLGQPFVIGSYAEFVCVLSDLMKNNPA